MPPHMKYELVGRLVFDADDVEDAFRQLALHFSLLAAGSKSKIPIQGTSVEIRKVKSKTQPPGTPTVRIPAASKAPGRYSKTTKRSS